MASQTGTLKFRQSDGTYTELYPKTTIAQVDGLQTQLDSINTSLQNKVDLNADATLSHIYVNAINSINRIELINETGDPNAYNSKAMFTYSNDSTILVFYPSKTNEAEFSLLELELENLRMQSMVGGNHKIDYFATQSYVANAISGAIAASY